MRVASVPATHVYVRRLSHPDVERLEDPSGDDLRTPCFLDPAWWRDHTHPPDLLHIHFGFEFYDPAQLVELVDVLEGRGIPLVYTVHDLRNPNHVTPELHDAGLEVLVPAASALVTLTDAAAREIRCRWGRQSRVLPHPHVVELDRIRDAGRRRRTASMQVRYRLLLHFKSLRPNMIRAPLLAAAADVARDRKDLDLEVRLHCDVVSPRGDNHDPDLVALACDLADEGLVDVRVHPYLSHDDLLEVVEGSDGFVLPYRFGTHSGLLELCRDLGTAVIAPNCGGYADQGAHHVFDVTDGFHATRFRETVAEAVAHGPPPPMDPDLRRRQREEIASGYVDVYRTVLARRSARTSG